MANAHLGSINIEPQSNRQAWWRSGMCKTGQAHRWQATVKHRTRGNRCPYNDGRATCPCNDLAHNHPGVAAEWDWEANGERTPETVTASSSFKAAWRCGLCGHRWSIKVSHRTRVGTGCPQCWRKARRQRTLQPSISNGAPHLLAVWDWEANARCGWQPDNNALGSNKKVHWVVQDECKLGLVQRWQAKPSRRVYQNAGSPFLRGLTVCTCNSLALQCPEAANLWDSPSNGSLNPHKVTWPSVQGVAWKAPDGRQWHQKADEVVISVRRNQVKSME